MEQISYLHGVLVEVSDHIDGLSGLLLNGTFLDVEDSLSHLSELLLLVLKVELEDTRLSHMNREKNNVPGCKQGSDRDPCRGWQ